MAKARCVQRVYRRPDIILYVNGLPLVFIELKNSNVKLKNAHDDNLANYKADIPLLFQYNAICILSNAVETRVGGFTAGWGHFFNWLRVDDEKEKIDRKNIERQGTSIERTIHGLCVKEKILDYVENFILFDDSAGETKKILARNHQFLGTNKAIEAVKDRKNRFGKLGVFWHTQGAGKSYSMVFFTRKVHRKLGGNFTFLILTDRDDLDTQIYKTFAGCGVVDNDRDPCRASSGEHLSRMLSEHKSYIFSLIQKFNKDVDSDEDTGTAGHALVRPDRQHHLQGERHSRFVRARLAPVPGTVLCRSG